MKTKEYDYLIVGAGLTGSMYAHKLTERGKKCLVIDKRPMGGGNLYCENIEGINVHKYGAHIFHTSNKKVWQFVNSFVEFNRYTNSPVASYKGKLYNLPFNMNTFYQMWQVKTPQEAKEKLEQQRAKVLQTMKEKGITEAQNLEQQARLLIGDDIFEKLIKGYTEKQWGRECKDLPAFIIKRLPVRFVFDNNYFNDNYQGIPIGGYNKLIEALLQRTEVRTNTDFFDNREYFSNIAEKIIFTGKVDEYFDYRFGKLEYRSVRFETEIKNTPNYQGNAVVNYTDRETPWTRIIEHKHFESFGEEIYKNNKTVISKEYSEEWRDDIEPYYPINNDRNDKLYLQYKTLSQQKENVVFAGRLAEYKYYDMAPIVEKVLNEFE